MLPRDPDTPEPLSRPGAVKTMPTFDRAATCEQEFELARPDAEKLYDSMRFVFRDDYNPTRRRY